VQPGGSNDELWASSEVGAGCCGSQAATSSVQAFGPSQAMPGSCGAGNGMRGLRADGEELNPWPDYKRAPAEDGKNLRPRKKFGLLYPRPVRQGARTRPFRIRIRPFRITRTKAGT